jgi:hypothetical protein
VTRSSGSAAGESNLGETLRLDEAQAIAEHLLALVEEAKEG